MNVILLRLNDSAIFKQFKGEGIGFKRFSFQFLSEIELCSCRTWCEGIIELCICWKCFGCCKGMTIFRDSNCYLGLHWVITHSGFWASDFFYSVLMHANFIILISERIEGYFTWSIIGLRLKYFTSRIFQDKTELSIFKSASGKNFTKVKLRCHWRYRIVVKLTIRWHNNIGCQDTSCCVFCDVNCHFGVHSIVVNICICSCYFTNSVGMCTFFIIWNSVKLDRAVCPILLRLENLTVFKQLEAESICL